MSRVLEFPTDPKGSQNYLKTLARGCIKYLVEFVYILCGIILCYLFGSIPFGFLIVRFKRGIDIRDYGSKSIGATNVGRILGRKYFFIVFSLDFMKGFLPVYLSVVLLRDGVILQGFCGLASLLGHLFPLWLGFRGGKGVATSLGIIFALNYLIGIIAILVWGVVVVVFRYISLGSIVTISVVPFLMVGFGERSLHIYLVMVIGGLVIFRHLSNIRRILKGVEYKLWQKG
jgi:glycerol-3-phosphate acyltransferase PlsY